MALMHYRLRTSAALASEVMALCIFWGLCCAKPSPPLLYHFQRNEKRMCDGEPREHVRSLRAVVCRD